MSRNRAKKTASPRKSESFEIRIPDGIHIHALRAPPSTFALLQFVEFDQ
jgi:hypothetical protein